MRTQYESKEDRAVERLLIQNHVSRKAYKLPKSYGFDFMVHPETKSPEVWEVKRRKKEIRHMVCFSLKAFKGAALRGAWYQSIRSCRN